ncbi:helix-turn-helix domain-containing protein [Labrenzia sp. DG1229]|uniref:helix-turn-helix domain-containing protein n=1 Tax=Labrenzia sp. DG1229 TaxID=681847 RepID=UPI0009FE97BC
MTVGITNGTSMKILKTEDLAERWSVSSNAIRNLCKKGEVPHFRIGKLYRFNLSLIEEYENKQLENSRATKD